MANETAPKDTKPKAIDAFRSLLQEANANNSPTINVAPGALAEVLAPTLVIDSRINLPLENLILFLQNNYTFELPVEEAQVILGKYAVSTSDQPEVLSEVPAPSAPDVTNTDATERESLYNTLKWLLQNAHAKNPELNWPDEDDVLADSMPKELRHLLNSLRNPQLLLGAGTPAEETSSVPAPVSDTQVEKKELEPEVVTTTLTTVAPEVTIPPVKQEVAKPPAQARINRTFEDGMEKFDITIVEGVRGKSTETTSTVVVARQERVIDEHKVLERRADSLPSDFINPAALERFQLKIKQEGLTRDTKEATTLFGDYVEKFNYEKHLVAVMAHKASRILREQTEDNPAHQRIREISDSINKVGNSEEYTLPYDLSLEDLRLLYSFVMDKALVALRQNRPTSISGSDLYTYAALSAQFGDSAQSALFLAQLEERNLVIISYREAYAKATGEFTDMPEEVKLALRFPSRKKESMLNRPIAAAEFNEFDLNQAEYDYAGSGYSAFYAHSLNSIMECIPDMDSIESSRVVKHLDNLITAIGDGGLREWNVADSYAQLLRNTSKVLGREKAKHLGSGLLKNITTRGRESAPSLQDYRRFKERYLAWSDNNAINDGDTPVIFYTGSNDHVRRAHLRVLDCYFNELKFSKPA